MDVRVGTSGYSYKTWRGTFYPEGMDPSEMLGFYAERFGSVEINNTFYRMPKASVLDNWAARVPSGFEFVIKASRRITHFSRLKESAAEPLSHLLDVLPRLGPHLGAVLFQLPPNFKKDADRLRTFLDRLPGGMPAAFEFRHDSWFDEETETLLADRNLALVTADTDDEDRDEPIRPTADWGYLRLRRTDYSDEAIARWGKTITGQEWRKAYVFFKHEKKGTGPIFAEKLLEVLG